MKLYATVTSERASKGQGGEYLDIEVKGKDKKVFLELHIEEKENVYRITGYAINAEQTSSRRSEHYINLEVTKGEKQKGEKCAECHEVHRDTCEHGISWHAICVRCIPF